MIISKWYTKAKINAFTGNIDLIGNPVKVALVDSSYTPDQLNHEFFSDIVGEVSSVNYTAGGKALANKTLSANDLEIVFNADDVEWEDVSLTARYAIIYSDFGSKPLIGFYDFGEDKGTSGGIFRVRFNEAGILKMIVE